MLQEQARIQTTLFVRFYTFKIVCILGNSLFLTFSKATKASLLSPLLIVGLLSPVAIMAEVNNALRDVSQSISSNDDSRIKVSNFHITLS